MGQNFVFYVKKLSIYSRKFRGRNCSLWDDFLKTGTQNIFKHAIFDKIIPKLRLISLHWFSVSNTIQLNFTRFFFKFHSIFNIFYLNFYFNFKNKKYLFRVSDRPLLAWAISVQSWFCSALAVIQTVFVACFKTAVQLLLRNWTGSRCATENLFCALIIIAEINDLQFV